MSHPVSATTLLRAALLVTAAVAAFFFSSVLRAAVVDQPKTLSHAKYAELFARARIGKTRISVLKKWPPPYQRYADQYGQRCYEWEDVGRALYNLCFKPSGVLALKVIE
jgi:hypothetical protein